MQRIYVLLLLVMLLISSCATQPLYKVQPAATWPGKNADNLVKEWGKPDELFASADSSTYYYIYNTQKVTSFQPAAPTVATSLSPEGRPVITNIRPSTGTPLFSSNCKIIFRINQQKIILDQKIEGNNC
jgi:hypothetical protein